MITTKVDITSFPFDIAVINPRRASKIDRKVNMTDMRGNPVWTRYAAVESAGTFDQDFMYSATRAERRAAREAAHAAGIQGF